MTSEPTPPTRRNTDTSRARLAARASYARRRHLKWITELRACGIRVIVPPEYTGLPIEAPAASGSTGGDA